MAQQTELTAVEWLIEQLTPSISLQQKHIDNLKEQAKQMEKEQKIDHLIGFQIYLNDKKLITNHDWDFEKMAKLYLKNEYGKKTK